MRDFSYVFKNAYWTAENTPAKTNLQQEIDDKIFGKSPIKFTSSRTVAEGVIKILEERIEEIQCMGDGNYFGHSGNQEFLDGFDIGFVQAFNLIKKELLK